MSTERDIKEAIRFLTYRKLQNSKTETATSNNIRDGLKHCAKKPNTKIGSCGQKVG